MARKKRSPEEIERRAKIRELLEDTLYVRQGNDYRRYRGSISQDRDTELHHPPASQFKQYVSYKDIKALMADLKAVYAAVDKAAAAFKIF